jgi:hypothetical protein
MLRIFYRTNVPRFPYSATASHHSNACLFVLLLAEGLASEAEVLLNHLQPTGHVTHQQFNIQQLYALPTLYLCVLYLSENKQRLLPLTA